MRAGAVAVGLGVALAVGLALWVTRSSRSPKFAPPTGVTQSALHAFSAFPVYGEGQRVHGLALADDSLASATARPDSVSLFYGRCPRSGGGESSCVYPLELQSWRACDRSPGLGAADRVSFRSFRGARLAMFSDGRAEIYALSVTVVIFAATHVLASAAEEALAPVNKLARTESSTSALAAPEKLSYQDLIACP